MKSLTKKIIVWVIWAIILIVISMCFALQNAREKDSLMRYFVQSSIVCSIPYIFFTTFYVIAVVTKQFHRMTYIFIVDVVSSIAIVTNIRYFYEGPLVARRSFLVIIVLMFIKGIVLFIRRPNTDC